MRCFWLAGRVNFWTADPSAANTTNFCNFNNNGNSNNNGAANDLALAPISSKQRTRIRGTIER